MSWAGHIQVFSHFSGYIWLDIAHRREYGSLYCVSVMSNEHPALINPDDYQRDVPFQPDEDEDAGDSVLGAEDHSCTYRNLKNGLLAF